MEELSGSNLWWYGPVATVARPQLPALPESIDYLMLFSDPLDSSLNLLFYFIIFVLAFLTLSF